MEERADTKLAGLGSAWLFMTTSGHHVAPVRCATDEDA